MMIRWALVLALALAPHVATAATKPTPVPPEDKAHMLLRGALAQRAKALQLSWGLHDDGVVGRRTFRALNFTPADQAQALRQTLARYQAPPARGKSITVNVPTAEIIAFENGVEVLRTRAVV